jgi:hypothetical protein
MRAEELATEFGIAGVLDFVETQHGLVKAAISLDGVWTASTSIREGDASSKIAGGGAVS